MTVCKMVSVCLANIIKDCGTNMLKSFFIISGAVLILMLVTYFIPQEQGKYINCGISEISPDFTNEMRQMCRQLRGTKL